MTVITGLNGVDWLAVFAASFGVGVAVLSRRRGPGHRVAGFLTVPLVIGFLTVVIAVAAHPDTIRRAGSAHLGAAPVALGVLGLGFVLADFVGTRVIPWAVGTDGSRSPDVASAVVLLTLVLAGFLVLGLIELHAPGVTSPKRSAARTTTTTNPPATTTTLLQTKDGRFEVVAAPELPGSPMGVAVDPGRDLGYVTLGEGTIVRFAPSSLTDEAPTFVVVAEGLDTPRGVAIVGDELVVSELGPLPCEPPFPRCQGEDVPGIDGSDFASVQQGEARILGRSAGRVVAYTIDAEGDLSDRRVLIDGLPVVDSLHGVNGLTLGPDGHLYLAIGNIDRMTIEVANAVSQPRKELLGTILEFLPDGTIVGPFATGLRNVYQVTFAPDGTMWAVDNDGPTPAGWREEELLQIKRGAEYGFPVEGSFTHLIRTDGAIAAIDAGGSAGIGWVSVPGLGSGLITGSCGRVYFVETQVVGGRWSIVDNHAERAIDLVMTQPECVSGVAVANDVILLTEFRWRQPGVIHVLAATGG